MHLTVINRDNFDGAINLLSRLADPWVKVPEWRKTLDNLINFAELKQTNPGYLLEIKGKFVFVLLTIEYSRENDNEKLDFVNFSSLYIEREYQYLAGVILNEIIKKYHGFIITDTTANDDSLKILNNLGFSQKSNGSMLKFPNSLSFKTKCIKRVEKNSSNGFAQYISDHIDIGCLVYEIIDEEIGRCFIILKKIKPLKSINLRFAAYLIYCSNHEIFNKNISKIMTKLLLNGILIIALPNRDEYSKIGYVYKRLTKQRISVLGNINTEHIDWLYTELAIYHY
jgi:hypothetical protein